MLALCCLVVVQQCTQELSSSPSGQACKQPPADLVTSSAAMLSTFCRPMLLSRRSSCRGLRRGDKRSEMTEPRSLSVGETSACATPSCYRQSASREQRISKAGHAGSKLYLISIVVQTVV